MRALLLILDGLGDRPWPELDWATPLEAAVTPNLDRLAAGGRTGLLYPLGRGVAPGSELAHFTLFGFPRDLFPGRAVFEAAGEGLDIEPGQVVYRGLFARTSPRSDGALMLDRHKAPLTDEQTRRLASEIDGFEHNGLSFRVVPTPDSQTIVFIDGDASDEVTDADPYVTGLPVPDPRPLDDARDPMSAERTAGALRLFLAHARHVLLEHPLTAELKEPPTFMLVKWGGRARDLPTFTDLTGFRGASVSSGVIYRGIARELGLQWREAPYLDDVAQDMAHRIDMAAEAFTEGADFVHVHTKWPDVAGHRKDPAFKRDVIEAIDAGLAMLAETGLPGDDTLLVVTGDHGTPAGTPLLHSGDAVPLLMNGTSIWKDTVTSFDERSCATGGVGHLDGADLMPEILNATGRVMYASGRIHPARPAYRPSEYPVFKPDDA